MTAGLDDVVVDFKGRYELQGGCSKNEEVYRIFSFLKCDRYML